MMKKHAFTLPEVLSALAIIAVVMVLMLASIRNDKNQAFIDTAQYDKVYDDLYTASKVVLNEDRKNVLKFSSSENLRDAFMDRLDVTETWEGLDNFSENTKKVIRENTHINDNDVKGVTLGNGTKIGFVSSSGGGCDADCLAGAMNSGSKGGVSSGNLAGAAIVDTGSGDIDSTFVPIYDDGLTPDSGGGTLTPTITPVSTDPAAACEARSIVTDNWSYNCTYNAADTPACSCACSPESVDGVPLIYMNGRCQKDCYNPDYNSQLGNPNAFVNFNSGSCYSCKVDVATSCTETGDHEWDDETCTCSLRNICSEEVTLKGEAYCTKGFNVRTCRCNDAQECESDEYYDIENNSCSRCSDPHQVNADGNACECKDKSECENGLTRNPDNCRCECTLTATSCAAASKVLATSTCSCEECAPGTKFVNGNCVVCGENEDCNPEQECPEGYTGTPPNCVKTKSDSKPGAGGVKGTCPTKYGTSFEILNDRVYNPGDTQGGNTWEAEGGDYWLGAQNFCEALGGSLPSDSQLREIAVQLYGCSPDDTYYECAPGTSEPLWELVGNTKLWSVVPDEVNHTSFKRSFLEDGSGYEDNLNNDSEISAICVQEGDFDYRLNNYVCVPIIVDPIGGCQYGDIAIRNARDLYNMRNDMTASYCLLDDIDLAEQKDIIPNYDESLGWEPIGSSSNTFRGEFHGNNHTISNLYINRPTQDLQALFAFANNNAVIRDVYIVHPEVHGSDSVSALVARIGGNTVVDNCHVTEANIECNVANRGAAGLVCYANGNVQIKNSSVKGTIKGKNYVGGIACAHDYGATIENCYVDATIEGDTSVGGISGWMEGTSYVKKSFSKGAVKGKVSVGGLVGHLRSSTSKIENSYSVADVSAKQNSGGLVGYAYNCSANQISSSYSTGTVSTNSNVTGDVSNLNAFIGLTSCALKDSYYNTDTAGVTQSTISGLIGLTTAQMKVSKNPINIYKNWADSAWCFNCSSYPVLKGMPDGALQSHSASSCGSACSCPESGNYASGTCACEKGPYDALSNVCLECDSIGVAEPYWNYETGQCEACPTNTHWDSDKRLCVTDGETPEGNCGEGFIAINSAEELALIGKDERYPISGDDAKYCLMKTIDLCDVDSNCTGEGWEPIGNNSTGFAGIFDGNGKEITNLFINRSRTTYVGLFGHVRGSDSEIKNLGVVGKTMGEGQYSVTGYDYTGGLVGFNNLGSITNSYATGSVTGRYRVSGLVGWSKGTISDSYATGGVTGVGEVGGLVGENSDGTISNSYATGSVTGSDAGGLVGRNSNGTISNSYATGSVAGNLAGGGLVGYNSLGSITNSYATGSVTGGYRVGGLVGLNYSGTISNSYATGGATGTGDVGGLVGQNDVATISNSYATGSVTGDEDVGGLVGRNNGTISNSYAIGGMTGGYRFGGLVGYNTGTIISSYYDKSTTGRSDIRGIGLATTQMYTSPGDVYVGWHADVWCFSCSDYPVLKDMPSSAVQSHNPNSCSTSCPICSSVDKIGYYPNCICPQNYYGALGYEGNCTQCPDGSTSQEGSTGCTCSANYYGAQPYNATQENGCTPCPENSTSAAGSNSCTCSANYYGAQANNATQENGGCSPCPEGSTSEAGSASCVCPAGKYWDNGDCTICPMGYYCPENSKAPTKCPNSRPATASTGSTQETDCYNCAANNPQTPYWTGNVCTSCYSAFPNSPIWVLSSCPAGYTLNSGECRKPVGDVTCQYTVGNICLVEVTTAASAGYVPAASETPEFLNTYGIDVAIASGNDYWAGAKKYCQDKELRLPSVTELHTIMNEVYGGSFECTTACGAYNPDNIQNACCSYGADYSNGAALSVSNTDLFNWLGGTSTSFYAISDDVVSASSVYRRRFTTALSTSNSSRRTVSTSRVICVANTDGESNYTSVPPSYDCAACPRRSTYDAEHNTCVCEGDDAEYNSTNNMCVWPCPAGTTGTYPDCVPNGTVTTCEIYDPSDNTCPTCWQENGGDAPVLGTNGQCVACNSEYYNGGTTPVWNGVDACTTCSDATSGERPWYNPTGDDDPEPCKACPSETPYWTSNGCAECPEGSHKDTSCVGESRCIYDDVTSQGTCGEDFIAIGTAEDLAKIGKDSCYPLDGHYCLMRNISLSAYSDGEGWEPIGGTTYYNNNNGFTGIFDGNNKNISGLYINRPSDRGYLGLFGISTGTIQNINLINVNVSGKQVSGLVGYQMGGNKTISNCHVTGEVTGILAGGGLAVIVSGSISNSSSAVNVVGDTGSGGLVGGLIGNISNSYATGNVTSFTNGTCTSMGGLAGTAAEGTISNSYATGNVTALGSGIGMGGLVGGMYEDATISNSYATGNVTAADSGEKMGGLVGYSYNRTVVENSYSIGEVTGNSGVGGLVGENSSTISNSYYDMTTTGMSDTGKGVGLTTAQMQVSKGSNNPYAQWSDTIWCFDCGAYPVLKNMPAGASNASSCGTSCSCCFGSGGYCSGTYDGCSCSANSVEYDPMINECVGECPEGTTGTYPNCVPDGTIGTCEVYDPSDNTCKTCYAKNDESAPVLGTNGECVPCKSQYYDDGLTPVWNGVDACTTCFASNGSARPVWDATANNGEGDCVPCKANSHWSGSSCLCNDDYEEDENGACVKINGCKPPELCCEEGCEWNESTSSCDCHVDPTCPTRYVLSQQVGTCEAGYIAINTAEELAKIGKDDCYPLAGHYCLMRNISLSAYSDGEGWEPIGGTSIYRFTGIFDGNNKKITNLYINRPNNYVGLFGFVSGSDAEIRNIGVNGVIFNAEEAGGLVANVSGNAVISNSYSEVSVTGGFVGGLVGGLYGSSLILSSYATGTIDCSAYEAFSCGGLLGQAQGTVSINNSYATGQVIGNESGYAGGLVGDNSGSITNSYATGSVTGGDEVGGLVGNNGGSITNSYYDTTTSGQSDTGKGVGLTTAQMQTAPNENVYVDWSSDNWCFSCADYPVLKGMPAGAPDATSCDTTCIVCPEGTTGTYPDCVPNGTVEDCEIYNPSDNNCPTCFAINGASEPVLGTNGECVPCNSTYYNNGATPVWNGVDACTTCADIKAHSHWDSSNSTCVCDTNYVENSFGECVTCPNYKPNSHWDSSNSTCVCDTNYVENSLGQCVTCAELTVDENPIRPIWDATANNGAGQCVSCSSIDDAENPVWDGENSCTTCTELYGSDAYVWDSTLNDGAGGCVARGSYGLSFIIIGNRSFKPGSTYNGQTWPIVSSDDDYTYGDNWKNGRKFCQNIGGTLPTPAQLTEIANKIYLNAGCTKSTYSGQPRYNSCKEAKVLAAAPDLWDIVGNYRIISNYWDKEASSLTIRIFNSTYSFFQGYQDSATNRAICIKLLCPECAPGDYPNCVASANNIEYDLNTNSCNNICPPCAPGTYPNCVEAAPNTQYSSTSNSCVDICPLGTTGTYPNCVPDGTVLACEVYDTSDNSCTTCFAKNGESAPVLGTNGECVPCSSEYAFGAAAPVWDGISSCTTCAIASDGANPVWSNNSCISCSLATNGERPKYASYITSGNGNDYMCVAATILQAKSGKCSAGYIRIDSADDFNKIGVDNTNYPLTGNYCLMKNITSTRTTPIGDAATPFSGIFEGNDKTISGISIEQPEMDNVGLFGYSTGQIRDLGITDISVVGKNYTGGLVGYNAGAIALITVSGSDNVTGSNYTGGLIGYNGGAIGKITVSGSDNVTGSDYTGGLVGYNDSSIMDVGVYADTSWIVGSEYTGGFVGYNNKYITDIRVESDASCTVTGTNYTGGFVGYNNDEIHNSIFDSDAGQISGAGSVGGFAGRNDGDIYYSGSNVKTVTGTASNVGGFVGYNKGFISNEGSSGTRVASAVTVQAANSNVGGFAGINATGGSISNCISEVDTVKSTRSVNNSTTDYGRVGGFCGQNQGDIIYSSSYAKTVQAIGHKIGGFIGYNNCSDTCTISNCAARTVNVKGLGHKNGSSQYVSKGVGGFVGTNGNDNGSNNSNYPNKVKILYCASKNDGQIGNSSTGLNVSRVGGFIGENLAQSVIKYSYIVSANTIYASGTDTKGIITAYNLLASGKKLEDVYVGIYYQTMPSGVYLIGTNTSTNTYVSSLSTITELSAANMKKEAQYTNWSTTVKNEWEWVSGSYPYPLGAEDTINGAYQ